jgi:hypothetical protein
VGCGDVRGWLEAGRGEYDWIKIYSFLMPSGGAVCGGLVSCLINSESVAKV